MRYRYLGGAFVPGIPARDLTPEEVAAIREYDPEVWDLAEALYVPEYDEAGANESAEETKE